MCRASLIADEYDALMSINVPSDKARTVVEAMERDLGTTLATKSDLLLLGERLLRTEHSLDARIDTVEQRLGSRIDAVEQKLDARIDALEHKVDSRIDALEQKLDSRMDTLEQKMDMRTNALEQRLDAAVATIGKDMEVERSSMIVRMGSIQVVTIGLLFAALRLI